MFRSKIRGRRRGKKTIKSQLTKLKKKVSKLSVNRELKEYFVAVSSLTTTVTTGSGFQIQNILSDIVQGQEYNTRIGRKVVPAGLNMRIVLRGSSGVASATLQPRLARIVLFQDLGYNGTAITPSQLLQSYSTATDNTSTALSQFNTDYVRSKNVPDGRIHILSDKRMWVHPVLSAYASECTKMFNINIPGKKLKEIYFNGSAAGTSVGGTVFMYVCLGQALAGADNADISYNSRLTYYDD